MSKQDQAIIEKLSRKNKKLRAADEMFDGHFDDDCDECRKARAIIRAALDAR